MSAATGFITPRDDLDDLDGYHSPQVEVAVRLNTNESPYAPPEGFVEAWLAALRDVALNRYPDRDARALREAAGAFLGQPAERLFFANGSNEVLQTLLLTFAGSGRKALVFEPSYALHSHIARLTATLVVEGERTDGFAVDPDSGRALVAEERPSVTFVCSPNNPSGTVEARETVVALCEAAASVGGLLVVDEAYGEFTDRSSIELVDESRPLVVVRTYSKVWSMAALRLGYLVGPARIVGELEKATLPYHLSAPTQLAGTLALAHVDAMRERVARLVEERGRLHAALTGLDGVTVFPSGANFLLFRIAGDATRVWETLLRRGVLVRDFSGRSRLEGCLRVTVGTPQENDAFLAALGEGLREVAVEGSA